MAHDQHKQHPSKPEALKGNSVLPNARLSRQVQSQLGQRLRAFYEALALGEQPVPDRFIEIINRLDAGRAESRQEKHS